MQQIDHKFVASGLILLGWGLLVFFDKAPVQPFIDVLRDILMGLGVYHTIRNLQPIERLPTDDKKEGRKRGD